MNEDRAVKRERTQAEEEHRRTNPLGILCLECGEVCYLRDERHNGKEVTRNKDK